MPPDIVAVICSLWPNWSIGSGTESVAVSVEGVELCELVVGVVPDGTVIDVDADPDWSLLSNTCTLIVYCPGVAGENWDVTGPVADWLTSTVLCPFSTCVIVTVYGGAPPEGVAVIVALLPTWTVELDVVTAAPTGGVLGEDPDPEAYATTENEARARTAAMTAMHTVSSLNFPAPIIAPKLTEMHRNQHIYSLTIKSYCGCMADIEKELFFIGHASFYIKQRGYTIFIDPFRVSDSIKEKADLILVTHAHFDHWSTKDIDKVSKSTTTIIAAPLCEGIERYENVTVARPGFKTSIPSQDIDITAIPAYNTKSERLQFHPRSNDWVGYIIEVNGMMIYHAGDTDFIPEMKHLKNIDVALLPMGGTYTMGVDEMIDAAKAINPKKVVPVHYKNLLGKEGSEAAEKKLKEHLNNVLFMKEVQPPTYGFS